MDILKTGGKLHVARLLLVASLLPVVISLVLACSLNKLKSNNYRCFAGFPTHLSIAVDANPLQQVSDPSD